MNILDLHFTESSSLNFENLSEKLWLGVKVVLIVMLSEYLELCKNVVDVSCRDSRPICDLFN